MRTVFLLLLLAIPSAADTRAGNVSALLPNARIERAGKVIDAKPSLAVQPDDVVRTDDKGRIRIKLLDQSVISLGVKSQLRIISHDRTSRQTSLELSFGKLRAQITKITRSGVKFELRTPNAVAGVIGTDFGVDASNPEVTKFICISGEVQLTSVDPNIPGTIACRGGATVTVRRGHLPDQPQPATQDQMETWKTITEPDAPEPKDQYKDY